MTTKVNVIHTRFSTDMQRNDSLIDQERRCREGLDRMGINHRGFAVISDAAVSGTRDDREGLNRIKRLQEEGRLGMLVVTDQSRLGRGDNVKGFIKDVVSQGGRFISISEGIDTDGPGWESQVIFNEIHHSRAISEIADLVRGGSPQP